MQPARLDLLVIQGATLRKPLLLMQPLYAYKSISEIQKTAPLLLTIPDHGIPDGWPTWIEGVRGWSALNRDKQRERFRLARVIDANTVEYNDLNGIDQAAAGGFLVYRLPMDMADVSAQMHIRDGSGALLMDLSTENGGLVIAGPGVLILTLSAAQTAAITWEAGRYDLELTMADDSVDRWMQGEVTVSREQTYG
jgi:hypothetical protein